MEKNWNSNWDGFKPGRWNRTSVNVRNFIQENYTPYEGDDSFLAGPTEATTKLWAQVMDLSKQEREAGGVLDMDTKIVSTITSHGPGYLDKDLEQIVGLQTDKPLKRAFMPYGGIKMAGKTGTAQHSKAHADHVLFVGYAPADQPEIAVSARIAYGYNSGYPAEIGRDMVRKYFNLADDADLVTGTASSLGSEIRGD